MMEIETYEPYHIGIKLIAELDLPSFRKRLIREMADNSDFTVMVGDIFDNQLLSEIITNIEDVRIEINYVAHALNVIGDNPEKTTKIFKKVLELLKSLNYELDNSLAVIYEVRSTVLINVNEDYSTRLTNAVSCNLDGFKELNTNVNINAIKIEFKNNESGKDQMTLTISSNPVRPKSSALVIIRYVHSQNEKILEFNDKIETRVLALLKSFGET